MWDSLLAVKDKVEKFLTLAQAKTAFKVKDIKLAKKQRKNHVKSLRAEYI